MARDVEINEIGISVLDLEEAEAQAREEGIEDLYAGALDYAGSDFDVETGSGKVRSKSVSCGREEFVAAIPGDGYIPAGSGRPGVYLAALDLCALLGIEHGDYVHAGSCDDGSGGYILLRSMPASL